MILCELSNTWANDGICDDYGNIPECNYDGGDCCLPLISNFVCYECFCYDDQSYHEFFETTAPYDDKNEIPNTCPENLIEFIGDGFCDDLTNVPICNLDGGDCCLDPKNDQYCIGQVSH